MSDDDFIIVKPTFWTRKRKICCGWIAGVTLILLTVLILLGIFVIGPKIAQQSINDSKLEFVTVSISNARNTSYALSSTGKISNAGFLVCS
jgi:hypothetical protein